MSKARELAELSRTVSDSADAVAITVDSNENTTFTGVVTANAGVVVDNITIDGTTLALSSGDLTLDIAGDIILDADGSQVYIKDGGTERFRFELDATPELVTTGGNFRIRNATSDADTLFIGNDGGSTITALTLDMSEGGSATFNKDIFLGDNAAARFGVDQDLAIFHDNSAATIRNNTGDLTIDVAGDIILDADGGDVILKDGGTEFMAFFNGTIGRTGDLTLDASGDIILDADGGDFKFRDGGAGFFTISNSSLDAVLKVEQSDEDFIIKGNDGGSEITALTLDMSEGGTAFFADDVRLTDNHAVRLGTDGDIVFYHDNSNGYLENGTGNLTLDVAGQIILDADTQGSGNGILLKDAGTLYGSIFRSSSHLHIKSEASDKDMLFMGNDGGSEITALTLDMSNAGAATFNGTIAGTRISLSDGVDDAGSAGSESVFNNGGTTADFRVESDSNTHMLFVDAGNNVVGIGTGSPATFSNSGGLAVRGATASDLALVANNIASGNNSHQMRYWNDAGTAYEIARTRVNVGAGQVNRGEYQFAVNNGAGLRPWLDVDYAGNVVFNQQSYDSDFRVESDTNIHGFMLDASTSTVGVNRAPSAGVGLSVNSTATNSSSYAFEACNATSNTKFIVRSDGYSGFYKSSSAAGFIHNTNGAITITPDTGGHFVFNEDGSDVDFRVETDGASNTFFVDGSTNNIGIQSGTEWAIAGGGSGTSSSGVQIDMSYDGGIYAGSTYWAGGLATGTNFWRDASGWHYKYSSRQATLHFQNSQAGSHSFLSQASGTAGAVIAWNSLLQLDRTTTVFNESGANTDFRVEGDANTHALFVDASTDLVSVGSSGGYGTLQVVGDNAASEYRTFVVSGAADKTKGVAIAYDTTNDVGIITAVDAGTAWKPLRIANTGLTIDQGLVVNESSSNSDFRVESDTESNALTVDGETGQVGVGSRRGFRFGNATLQGNAGSSGGGYPVIGYNIRFSETGSQYGTLVADTSWRLDIGTNHRLSVHSRSASSAVTGAATYTAGPYVALNGTSWTSSSDARLKKNVNTITGAIDKVKAMRPVNYTWIHDGEDAPNQIGFIAQEMALIVPEVVDIPEDDEVHQGIQYEKLVPVLTAALQEALTKIETLETRISALES